MMDVEQSKIQMNRDWKLEVGMKILIKQEVGMVKKLFLMVVVLVMGAFLFAESENATTPARSAEPATSAEPAEPSWEAVYKDRYDVNTFNEVDANKDGVLSTDELKANQKWFENYKDSARLKHADTNGDGVISFDEAKAERKWEIDRAHEKWQNATPQQRAEMKKNAGKRLEKRGEQREKRGEQLEKQGEKMQKKSEKLRETGHEKSADKLENRGKKREQRGERMQKQGKRMQNRGERMRGHGK